MTTLLLVLSGASLLFAAIPAALFFANIRLFRPPPALPGGGATIPGHSNGTAAGSPEVSVLIPARNEAGGILACVESVLASRGGVDLEVVVLDDQSDDDTAAIVERAARRDPRLRLERAPALPPGWCGKQHACHALSRLARGELLMFIDADVRLAPDAVARAVAFQRASGAALVSGFPRQETGSLGERLLIPLIHVVLLGFLPLARMRASTHASYGAGCGQLFLARRDAYEAAGGHAAIRASLHDGITLPRAFRRAGFATDLFDATGVAACRMYRGARETWRGLAKNATEGMASPAAIVPWTILLGAGHVLPAVLVATLVVIAIAQPSWAAGQATELRAAGLMAGAATALGYAVRFAAARRFRQSFVGAALHPVGVLALLAIQWHALARRLTGAPATWRGRPYPPSIAPAVPHPSPGGAPARVP